MIFTGKGGLLERLGYWFRRFMVLLNQWTLKLSEGIYPSFLSALSLPSTQHAERLAFFLNSRQFKYCYQPNCQHMKTFLQRLKDPVRTKCLLVTELPDKANWCLHLEPLCGTIDLSLSLYVGSLTSHRLHSLSPTSKGSQEGLNPQRVQKRSPAPDDFAPHLPGQIFK